MEMMIKTENNVKDNVMDTVEEKSKVAKVGVARYF